ncbi:rhodanese-like domain-containing protein [Nocardia camponoti]|uniref:Rhodanese domain-containing protein n=1 Tax=Nocardia camponoti TaxID=1616106 RepID=A0A917QHZ4_9NOCA|nr:rhodanese-like domain-containing protein [Nocardia camponoti]GGK52177.1 hypothetical protein GCM10011591_24850 [Nocardia camponoti]
MNYAGDITPEQAWEILTDNPDAVLVDVRTEGEWATIGVPDTSSVERPSHFIEWVDNTGARNPEFGAELAKALGDRPEDAPVLFICRSGQRSAHAANLATAAGIAPSYNVLDGFEGGPDAFGQRGSSGWRAVGLPWRQA